MKLVSIDILTNFMHCYASISMGLASLATSCECSAFCVQPFYTKTVPDFRFVVLSLPILFSRSHKSESLASEAKLFHNYCLTISK